MPDVDFSPQPHEEAIAIIRGKPAVSRAVFDRLLPELRARVFTITGIESANTLQRARDIIAKLPEGSTWAEVQEELLQEISPFFGSGEEGEKAAERRAELLMRTHGFQAFQAANWQTAQADEDTTHLQYLATEDTHVRESHLALNGVILPKDDSFWEKHTPPWEYGCRCRIRPMNPDMVDDARADDEKRAPENRLVMEGPVAEQLRNGTLMRDGQRFDVTPPSDRPSEDGTPYVWHPDHLTIPLAVLRERYDAEVFGVFEEYAKKTMISPEGPKARSLWDWLEGKEIGRIGPIGRNGTDVAPTNVAVPAPAPEPKVEPRPELTKAVERARAAGFAPEMAKAIEKTPKVLDRHFGTVKFDRASVRRGAFYQRGSKTIHMVPNTREWSGRPEVFHHEFGHHVHHETGHITDFHVHPDWEAAMAADLKKLKAGGLEKWGKLSAFGTTRELYGHGPFENTTLEQNAAMARLCDTIGGITKGRQGFGHKVSYYRTANRGAMEAYANTLSAVINEDKVFEQMFPNLVATLKGLLSFDG